MTVESSALIDRLCDVCRALPEGDGPGIRDEIRAIGVRLWELGGFHLVEDAFWEVCGINWGAHVALEQAWTDCVGDWSAPWAKP